MPGLSRYPVRDLGDAAMEPQIALDFGGMIFPPVNQ